MQCSDTDLLVHAWLDDELEPARALELERHLDECPACGATYRRYARLRSAVQAAPLYQHAPAGLRERVSAQWRPAPAPRAARRWAWDWAPLSTALAAALVVATGIAVLLALELRTLDVDRLAADAVAGHVRSLLAEHLVDVQSTDQHTVKPWFDGRLDFAPQVHELAVQGFPLAGGRLDVLAGRRVAALVYRRRLHAINLFEWPSAAAAAPLATTRDGYQLVGWSEGGLRYLAVSSAGADELAAFERAFRAAAAPAPAAAVKP